MTEETQVVKYSVVEADIANMKSIYMDLVITDLDDKEQFNQVKEARLVVKGKRCAVENERKALKKSALEWGRQVDGKANEIFALIEPIETHLQTEENKVIEEEKRIEREEEERQRKINQKRVDDLMAVECVMPFLEVATMTDDEFQCLLGDKTFEFEERKKAKAEEERLEKARLAKEAADRKAEDERLAKQKVEQDAKDKKQREESESLKKEKQKLRDEKTKMRLGVMSSYQIHLNNETEQLFYSDDDGVVKITHSCTVDEIIDLEEVEFASFLDGIRLQVSNKLKENAEREAKAEAEAEERAKAEAARQEALKPDKEKLHDYAGLILTTMAQNPKVNDELAHDMMSGFMNVLNNLIVKFQRAIEEL